MSQRGDDDDDEAADAGRPRSLFALLTTGNKRLALAAIGVFIGASIALAVSSGGARIAYSDAAPAVRRVFWIAGLAFVLSAGVMPDKSRRFPFAAVWMDGLGDFLFLAAVIVAACVVLSAEIRLLS